MTSSPVKDSMSESSVLEGSVGNVEPVKDSVSEG